MTRQFCPTQPSCMTSSMRLRMTPSTLLKRVRHFIQYLKCVVNRFSFLLQLFGIIIGKVWVMLSNLTLRDKLFLFYIWEVFTIEIDDFQTMSKNLNLNQENSYLIPAPWIATDNTEVYGRFIWFTFAFMVRELF